MNPNDTEALSRRASVLGGLNRYDEAINTLDKALSINPTLQEAAHLKADAIQALKNNSSAKNG
jgi:tetratricopeptide (TPR) repeat protein